MGKAGKIVTILLWVLITVSAILIISLMANISDNDADAVMGGWINSNLIWTYILAVTVAGIAVISGILQMVTDKKAAKGGIIALVFFAVIAGVSYLFAPGDIPQFIGVDKFINDGTLTAGIAKLVDTGLIATYILLALAILSIVFTSVASIFK